MFPIREKYEKAFFPRAVCLVFSFVVVIAGKFYMNIGVGGDPAGGTLAPSAKKYKDDRGYTS